MKTILKKVSVITTLALTALSVGSLEGTKAIVDFYPQYAYEGKVLVPDKDSVLDTNKVDIDLKIKKVQSYTPVNHPPRDWSDVIVKINLINSNSEISIKSNDYHTVATQQIQNKENSEPFNITFKEVPLLYKDKNYIGCTIDTYVNKELTSIIFCEDSVDIGSILSHKVIYNGELNTSPIFRYWSDIYMSHFYIGNLDEKKEVDKNPEWKLEGVAYNAGKYNKSQNKCETQDQSPVYRFHSKEYMSHFYSINKAEADYITSNYPEDLWKYEGIEFCAYPNKADGTFGVHRFWSAEYENHFFTTNNAEKDYVIKNYTESTWKYEGIAFYVE